MATFLINAYILHYKTKFINDIFTKIILFKLRKVYNMQLNTYSLEKFNYCINLLINKFIFKLE